MCKETESEQDTERERETDRQTDRQTDRGSRGPGGDGGPGGLAPEQKVFSSAAVHPAAVRFAVSEAMHMVQAVFPAFCSGVQSALSFARHLGSTARVRTQRDSRREQRQSDGTGARLVRPKRL